MKTNKFYFTAAGFLAGIVSGISIIGLLAFTNNSASPGPGNSAIPATVANTYFKNYMAGATVYNQVIKGFTIDKTQLDAMNSIAAENSLLTGFRIYFGKDNNAQKIAIVVGIDASGRDAVTNTIYNSMATSNNPCPPICDVNSPIVKN